MIFLDFYITTFKLGVLMVKQHKISKLKALLGSLLVLLIPTVCQMRDNKQELHKKMCLCRTNTLPTFRCKNVFLTVDTFCLRPQVPAWQRWREQ